MSENHLPVACYYHGGMCDKLACREAGTCQEVRQVEQDHAAPVLLAQQYGAADGPQTLPHLDDLPMIVSALEIQCRTNGETLEYLRAMVNALAAQVAELQAHAARVRRGSAT